MTHIVPADFIESGIYVLRDHKVMIDSDLAHLYGVATKVLVQAVKRNISRFPDDFMFQLSIEEFAILRSQTVTSRSDDIAPKAPESHGGRRYPPYAFTEQGVAMLSSVLRSDQAIAVNIGIMRAFVRLRELLASNKELAARLDEMEKKYDNQLHAVFEAIRQLMSEPPPTPKKIGFRPKTKG
jgi:hypothetical protein